MRKKLIRCLARTILKVLPLIMFPRANAALYRLMGYQLEKNVRIYSSSEILGEIQVAIGEGTFVGHRVLITGGLASISIGRNCDISDRVGIVCGTHEIDLKGERVAGVGKGLDIGIGDGVWIGFGALILPGVIVGDKSVVAAGTVVNKDVDAHTVVAGNPMRVIRQLREEC